MILCKKNLIIPPFDFLNYSIFFRTPLMQALIKRKWCQLLPVQLEFRGYESTEKVLAAISASALDCKQIFNKNNLKSILKSIRDRFQKELKEEEDEDFKSYLRTFPEQIDKINDKLGQLLTL